MAEVKNIATRDSYGATLQELAAELEGREPPRLDLLEDLAHAPLFAAVDVRAEPDGILRHAPLVRL